MVELKKREGTEIGNKIRTFVKPGGLTLARPAWSRVLGSLLHPDYSRRRSRKKSETKVPAEGFICGKISGLNLYSCHTRLNWTIDELQTMVAASAEIRIANNDHKSEVMVG